MINQLLGQRYEILEKVGEGPLFTTFKARDNAMNRVVAVKTLSSRFADEPNLIQALRPALTETVALNHTGLTRFYEYREDKEANYYVSEFVRGIDLKERIRRIAPFTLSLAVDFGCSMAEALQYAHSSGQVHGDLRPQNIIISPEGVLKISGFGVQKAVSKSTSAQLALLEFSAPYHAPEVSTTSAGTASGDLYAVGAILYEMLTGTTVYAGAQPDEQADSHAFSPIPTAHTINPAVPRSVDAILTRCLQKRPEDRYSSMTDLLSDLKSVRDSLRFGKPISVPVNDVNRAPVNPSAVGAVVTGTYQSGAGTRSDRPNRAPNTETSSNVGYEKNRLRAQDERVSVYIKVAIATVTSLIVVCCLVGYGIYLSHWIVPPPVTVPPIVGQSIDDVRKMAAEKKIKLIEHAEYNDNPRGIVYQTDQDKDSKLRAMHAVNIWYSRGPEYVNVPNVVNLSREDAEQKLKDAGLKVGRVTPEYNDKTPENIVISQDVTSKKRVFHDTVVSLAVSNGPNPDTHPAGTEANPKDPNTTRSDTDAGTADTGNQNEPRPGDNTNNADGATSDSHTFSRYISINRDGRGRRRVRVEYLDGTGSHPPVIDEGHDEGDKILIKFDYTGTTITLRVYYDDVLKSNWNLNPEATKRATIQ